MAIYCKVATSAAVGATADTFDSVGDIVTRSDASRSVGVLLEAGVVTTTAAEAMSGQVKLSSSDLGVAEMIYSAPPYVGGAVATNDIGTASATEFLPFNWALKGKETLNVAYSTQLDPTAGCSVVAGWVYSAGPKATVPTDMEWMPDMNPLICKGADTEATLCSAVSTAGTDLVIPAWANRLVGLKQFPILDLITAGEEVVGYNSYTSSMPDFGPQEWPFQYSINASLGTPVGAPVAAFQCKPYACSFPTTKKNETISPTIALNVAVTTGDDIGYSVYFA